MRKRRKFFSQVKFPHTLFTRQREKLIMWAEFFIHLSYEAFVTFERFYLRTCCNHFKHDGWSGKIIAAQFDVDACLWRIFSLILANKSKFFSCDERDEQNWIFLRYETARAEETTKLKIAKLDKIFQEGDYYFRFMEQHKKNSCI